MVKWWEKIVGGDSTGTSARVCERGHPMDPNWKTCSYCEAEARVSQRTARLPESENLELNKPTKGDNNMARATTQIGGEGSDETGGTTTFDDTSADDVTPRRREPSTHERKITGILVTFTWRFQGELFVLYEGRNVIGSGPSCDVQIVTDPTMSGEHALILCRAGRDELHDMLSTNGTFLDEQYVARDGADLTDGAMIKTGGTVFEFRKITSGSKAVEHDRPRYVEQDSRKPRPGGETAI